jgi:hypothetical protein
VRYLREHRLDAEFCSNAPDILFYFVGVNAKLSPPRTLYESQLGLGDKELERLEYSACGGRSVYLVWFNKMNREYPFILEELQKRISSETFWGNGDGTISRVLESGGCS